MTVIPAVIDPFAAVSALAPLIAAQAGETERGRSLAAPVVQALRAAGLFGTGIPAVLGGLETPVIPAFRAIEEAARADGATGWNLMIAHDSGLLGGFLQAADARALIASMQRPIPAGSFSPGARAHQTAGGYRLTGRWSFASGCQQADVIFVSGMLYENDQPVLTVHGTLATMMFVLRADQIQILDTWNVTGLRGTGSHDIAVQDCFIAEGYAQPMNMTAPVEHGPLYAFPLRATLAGAKTAVALGIAQHALEAFKDLARVKRRSGQTTLLGERSAVQADVARAEALVRGARAFLYEAYLETWQCVVAGRPPTLEQRALLRLAAVDGVQRAVQAVDLLCGAAGATAIYESSPLERCFRDIHVVPAHAVVQPAMYEAVGRALLGDPTAAASL